MSNSTDDSSDTGLLRQGDRPALLVGEPGGFSGLGNDLKQLLHILYIQRVERGGDQTEWKLGDRARGKRETVSSAPQVDDREVIVNEARCRIGRTRRQ